MPLLSSENAGEKVAGRALEVAPSAAPPEELGPSEGVPETQTLFEGGAVKQLDAECRMERVKVEDSEANLEGESQTDPEVEIEGNAEGEAVSPNEAVG